MAAGGGLQIVPERAAHEALVTDYAKMHEDQVMVGDVLHFEELVAACKALPEQANGAAQQPAMEQST